MKKVFLLVTICTLFTMPTFANYINANGEVSFLPENDLNIPPTNKSRNNISNDQFKAIAQKIENEYRGDVTKQDAKLKIKTSWYSGKVNAMAYRKGSTYYIKVYGGLARHGAVTRDALIMVFCHEMGHQLGGSPLMDISSSVDWAATEGQADYFAAQKCFKRVIKNENVKIDESTTDPYLVDQCNNAYNNYQDFQVCLRSGIASTHLINLMSDLMDRDPNSVNFSTPDQEIVISTKESYPSLQCRLDSYFQGTLCNIDPYSPSTLDPSENSCSRANGDLIGNRPLCWYRP